MKKINPLITKSWAAFATVMLILLIWTTAWAQSPKKVMLVPFTLNTSEDLSYLQKGIGQMLASRLTQEDKVSVIQADTALAKDPKIKEKARAQGADYLVNGSLTMLGKSVSTDAYVVDLTNGKQVLNFSRVGKDQAIIIDHVDQLAAEINTRLFGGKATSAAPAAPPVSAAADPESSIYQHPEKLIQQADEGPEFTGAKADYRNPEAALLLRGRRVPYQMRSVTAGDVDGDGRNDIVCIGPTTVTAYRIERKQLVKIAEIEARISNFVGVDAVDVDANGKAEIFVTSFDNKASRAASFVLEWNGKDLVRIADNLNWYFRAIEIPHRGIVLAGQRQGVDDPFASTIHEMGRKGGSYEPQERLPLPRGLNIYGFAYGNVRSPHDTDIVAYNDGGFIQILNPRGVEQWVTSERYGGSHVFIEFPNPMDRSDRLYIYLSPRVLLFDLDGDGLQEIFVVDNEKIASAFDRVRLFKNGRLTALKWDELGMTRQWQTRSLAKYISDFTLADIDGDGKPEVVASVVQNAGGSFSKAHSYLAVFKLARQTVSESREGQTK